MNKFQDLFTYEDTYTDTKCFQFYDCIMLRSFTYDLNIIEKETKFNIITIDFQLDYITFDNISYFVRFQPCEYK